MSSSTAARSCINRLVETMNREFLDLYNRELQLLNEQAREFAEEYPGIAERLGGLVGDRTDPMIAGLLEGAAFLAARVQLKLKHEFSGVHQQPARAAGPELSRADALGAAGQDRCRPIGDPALREGMPHRARLLSRRDLPRARPPGRLPLPAVRPTSRSGRSTSTAAEYYRRARRRCRRWACRSGTNVVAGLRLSLTHRMAARLEDETADAEAREAPEAWFAGCRTTELPVHLLGAEADAIALYEQLFARLRRRLLPLSRRVRRSRHRAARRADCLEQIGFERGRGAAPERRPRLPRLRSPARVLPVPAQVPRLQADRARPRSCRS